MRRHKVEVRARTAKNGQRFIEGYAARFNAPSVDGDSRGFVEKIAPGSFSRALAGNPDILALVDHDERRMVGRTSSGSLQVRQTDKGLAFRIAVPNTTLGNDLYEMCSRGDYRECSFSMDVSKDDWTDETDDKGRSYILRSISEVSRVYDVSPVILGAYGEAASCAARDSADDDETIEDAAEDEFDLFGDFEDDEKKK